MRNSWVQPSSRRMACHSLFVIAAARFDLFALLCVCVLLLLLLLCWRVCSVGCVFESVGLVCMCVCVCARRARQDYATPPNRTTTF